MLLGAFGCFRVLLDTFSSMHPGAFGYFWLLGAFGCFWILLGVAKMFCGYFTDVVGLF